MLACSRPCLNSTRLSRHAQVFPSLYLPVMEEANLRVLRPYRRFLPIPEWFRFRSRMAKLNAYLINFFRCVCVWYGGIRFRSRMA